MDATTYHKLTSYNRFHMTPHHLDWDHVPLLQKTYPALPSKALNPPQTPAKPAANPAIGWRPILKNDNVVWVTEVDGQEEIVPYEPHTSWFERVKEGVLTLVPGAKYY